MTDKVQKIREMVEKRYEYWKEKESNSHSIESEIRMSECKHLLLMLDSLQEEPVSENLNTESMIESYKQRLISQANGMKNSPLIDMCLASYKHGINETLDILNLSNVQRTIKNWKEPTSEDLEEASKEWLIPQLDKSYAAYGETKQMELTHFDGYAMLDAIEFGAKWQKENLWKPAAAADDLPEIDREVIALLDNCSVVFAHRPPEYWDGKDIVTGKVTRNYPKTYDKGGWNIPNVKWWLDCSMPKEIEL